MKAAEIRTFIPPKEQEAFDGIIEKRVLGASKHIKMIGDMFTSMAESINDGNELLQHIRATADFFHETRGEASQAVSNAIKIMCKGLFAMKGQAIQDIREKITDNCTAYAADARTAQEKITAYTGQLANAYETILVFDYSGTVDAFLSASPKKFKVIIPESRSIDGGHAFVKTCVKFGHLVWFVPDAAMWHVLPQTQAVFIGAETFFPDGTAQNTTGSDLLAVLCEKLNIPYYVLTPMIKLDIRPVTGYVRPAVVNNLADRLAGGWSDFECAHTDFECPELLPIPPRYITAYITEQGIIPADAMYGVALAYAKQLEEM